MAPGGSRRQVGLEPRNCVICEKEFQPYRDYQVSCSTRYCRDRARGLSPRKTDYELACKHCGKAFVVSWSGIGRPPSCPDCATRLAQEKQDRQNAARRLETAVDPEARRAINLKYSLVRYGLTPDELAGMVAAQVNCCAICGEPPDPNGTKAASRLHVDHDHVTGRNRDLLCCRCNQGIGYFERDIDLFLKAYDYIKRHRAT